jgi:hypothetical protein
MPSGVRLTVAACQADRPGQYLRDFRWTMDDAKQFAMCVLSAIRCRVAEIPESDAKRADLLATDDDSTYLIEVKQKLDDSALLRDDAQRMACGEVVFRSASTGHNNRISAILCHGRDQLDLTPGPPDAFRLIWLHVSGIDRDLHWKRAFATFYGRVQLWPKEPPGDRLVECYYFDYSAARSIPSIDAMILSDHRGLQLCLNEFSQHIDRFCGTALCRRFAEGNAVVDPCMLAANGSILVCRAEIPRKDDEDVLNALREQTGVLYAVLRPVRHSASAKVEYVNGTY